MDYTNLLNDSSGKNQKSESLEQLEGMVILFLHRFQKSN